MNSGALKITLIYIAVGALWILFSDKLVSSLVADRDTLVTVELLKGWFYILATGGLVYLLISRHLTTLQRSDAALRESAERFQAILDNTPAAVYVRAADGRYLLANRQHALRFAGSGQPTGGISADERAVITGGMMLSQEEQARDRDGTRTYLSFRFPLRGADGQAYAVCGVATDISERKHAETLLAGQGEVLEMLALDQPLPAILARLVQVIEGQCPGGRCTVLLLDESGTRLHGAAVASMPAGYSQAIEGAAIGPAAGSCGTAAWRKQPVLVSDVTSDPLWVDHRELAAAHGVRACWATPILAGGGKVLGTFAVYHRQPRSPTAADLKAIDLAQHVAAIAIERRRSDDLVRRSNQRFELVSRATNDAVWDWDMADGSLWWNDGYGAMFGYDRGDVPATLAAWVAKIHPDEAARVERNIHRVVGDGSQTWSDEYRYRHRDGSYADIYDRGFVMRDAEGKAVRMVGAMMDISARKRAEAEVQEYADRLQALSRRLVEVQEAERRHLARELHDQIGQVLTAISITIQAAQRSAGPEAAPRLSEGVWMVDRAIQQVRNLSLDLRPSLLDDLGLEAALRWYIDRQGLMSGIAMTFASQLGPARLPSELETTCFRVVQESLTNVVRHAQAHLVTIDLRRDGEWLRLRVRDDGIGFDPAAAGRRKDETRSVGLHSMYERVQIVGGQLEIESKPGGGTRVSAHFPLPVAVADGKAG